MDPGDLVASNSGTTRPSHSYNLRNLRQRCQTSGLAPSNSGTSPHLYNLRNLPARETIHTQNTSNARQLAPNVHHSNYDAQGNNRQQPNLEELQGRNSQRQLNLESQSDRNNQQQPILLPEGNSWQQIPGVPEVYMHEGQIPQIRIFRQPNSTGLQIRNSHHQPNLTGPPVRNNQPQPNLVGLPRRNNSQQPNLDELPRRNNLPEEANPQIRIFWQPNLAGPPVRTNQPLPNLAGLSRRNNIKEETNPQIISFRQLNLAGLPGRNNQQPPKLAGPQETISSNQNWLDYRGRNNIKETNPQIRIIWQPNVAGLPTRNNQQPSYLTGLQGTNNQHLPNLTGQSGSNNGQQPNLQLHERLDDQRNHQREDRRRASQFKLPSLEIPEAELDGEQCAICLRSAREYKENRRPVARTDCGHFFCIPCIYKWKKRSRNCPLCRQPILQRRGSRGLYLFHVI
ncbi:hypothetical protein JTE90_004522 [Oedothorax gibbosus]|uniref:RING-type domain-containing protein n=1 Tax=Oedothorax gibbosus TaxID=931172 RepID=A0AAV6VCA1_9ARAC|nr:hypothetical protein JTE90_004522 [Oedothorax gibbosus]